MTTSMLVFTAVAGLATLLIAMSLCLPMVDDNARVAPTHASGRRAAVAGALAVPLLATSLYAVLGAPRTLLVEPVSAAHRMNNHDMAQAAERLAQKLKLVPDDLEAWFVLARSYQAMERWRDAATAYREALRLAPHDPQLMADLADVLASARGGQIAGEPMEWIVKALALDPTHGKSRALAAMAAYRAGRLDEASFHWDKLAAYSAPGSDGSELARQGMARIRDKGVGPPLPEAVKPGPPVGN